MVNPTTPNIVLEQPLRGSEVGTWDTPVNSNTGIIDSAFGAVTTVALTSASVTLTASQAQSSIIRITGTLSVFGVTITLPSIHKGWTIDNRLTNSPSSLAVMLLSSNATYGLGMAPGVNDIFYDGVTIQYRNLGKIGEYWDYAGTVVPAWVAISSVPPWLQCSGAVFSSATYPILTNLLGTTTLPDARGRARFVLNDGTGRITTAVTNGIDGNTVLAAGGTQTTTLSSVNMALSPVVDPGHTHPVTGVKTQNLNVVGGGVTTFLPTGNPSSLNTDSAFTGITVGSATPTAFSNLPPGYVGGITMIRAA